MINKEYLTFNYLGKVRGMDKQDPAMPGLYILVKSASQLVMPLPACERGLESVAHTWPIGFS